MRTLSLSLLTFGFAIILLGGTANHALADKPKRIGQYHHWSAFTYQENGGKVCFMAASPKSAKGNYSKRGDIFALITHRTANDSKNVVSYMAGYPYKDESKVTITIDGQSHKLFTKGNTAWAPDGELDKKLTELIKKGNRMVVKGQSSRGTLTTDTFSLRGSTAAYNAITKACQ